MVWKSWRLDDWNDALVRSYFRRTDDEFGIVETRHIVVTAEQFKLVTGDLSADPQEAKNAFFQSLRAAILSSSQGSLIKDAIDRLEDWNPTSLEVVPPFFAHLLSVCCAAAFCEDPDDATSVHGNLRDHLLHLDPDRYDQGSFVDFPRLFEEFTNWTARNSDRYRILILPSREEFSDGRMTLIGPAVTLTFPRTTDASLLSDCLADLALDGTELSIDQLPRIAHAISNRTGNFSGVFRKQFDQFSALLRARRYEDLGMHPMWNALMESFCREVVAEGLSGPWLFAESQFPEGFEFSLLSPLSAGAPVGAGGLPEGYATEWTAGTGMLPGETLRGLFGGSPQHVERLRKEAPQLWRKIDQGVLLFRSSSQDWLELARDRHYENVRLALLRQGDLAHAFLAAFGGSFLYSPFPGWALYGGTHPRLLSDKELEGVLGPVSCLNPIPLSTRRHHGLSGGIRYDGEYLGNGFRSPCVRSAILSGLDLECDGSEPIPFCNEGDRWSLPIGLRLQGEFRIEGQSIGREERLHLGTVRFGLGPDRPAFGEPVAQNHLAEGIQGFRGMSGRPPYLGPPEEIRDLSHLFIRDIRIGKQIGEFSPGPESHAIGWSLIWDGTGWRFDFIRSGDERRCSDPQCACPSELVGLRVGDLRPERMGESYLHRTRWRDFLLKATPANPCAGKVRGMVRGDIQRPKNLPHSSGTNFTTLPRLRPERSTFAIPISPGEVGMSGATELGRTLTALAQGRSTGIDLTDWTSAVRHHMGATVDPFGILRAWEECGRLTVAVQARYNRRRIFPEAPVLAVFRTLEGLQAVEVGLWSPEQKAYLADIFRANSWRSRISSPIGAAAEPLYHWLMGNEDEKVPAVVREACQRESIRLASFDPEALLRDWDVRQYDAAGRPIPDAEAVERNQVAGLGEIQRHLRRNAPTSWSVPGMLERWSYSRPLALAMLADSKGLAPFLPSGDHAIVTAHRQIHLPLPYGRLSAWTGPSLPGPEGGAGETNGGWAYEFPSPGVRDEILARAYVAVRRPPCLKLEECNA